MRGVEASHRHLDQEPTLIRSRARIGRASRTQRTGDGSAGDADNGVIGSTYSDFRRPDRRIPRFVHDALGDTRSVPLPLPVALPPARRAGRKRRRRPRADPRGLHGRGICVLVRALPR